MVGVVSFPDWDAFDRWFDDFRVAPRITKPSTGIVDTVVSWAVAGIVLYVAVRLAR